MNTDSDSDGDTVSYPSDVDSGVVFLHDQSDFDNFDATDNHNEIASALNASFRFNDDQVVDSINNDGGASFLPVTGNFNEADFPQLFEDRSDTGLSSAVVTELGAYDAIVATSG